MTCPEYILGLLGRPKRPRDLADALEGRYTRAAVYSGLRKLAAQGAVQKRGQKYVRVGEYTPPQIGRRTEHPTKAGAAGKALGISRQAAHDGIKAGRIVYTEGIWIRL
jgi:hypothetical protein